MTPTELRALAAAAQSNAYEDNLQDRLANAVPDLLDRIVALEAIEKAARELVIEKDCWGHAHHSPDRCSAGRLRAALEGADHDPA